MLRVAFALICVLTSSCFAGTDPVIPEQLQQDALSCAGEAAQLCPDIWTAEDHGYACMLGKRSGFSARCRIIYDRVAHIVKH